jgi:hypothetical protein
MQACHHYIFFLLLTTMVHVVKAQDITGTWEGDLGGDQFLQLNIIQTGNKICGYTRDHVLADQRSYCKAFFEGYFDKKRQKLYISGKYFIQNSGSHVLMKLNLSYKIVKGEEVLEERPAASQLLLSLLSPFGDVFDNGSAQPQINTQYVYIKKVSDKPREINELMKDCISADRKKTDTVAKKISPPRPKDTSVVKMSPPKPKDSTSTVRILPPPVRDTAKARPQAPPPPVRKDGVVTTPKNVTERKNKEQSRITVNTKSIKLKVYDNAIMDGDTVSILYNGKMLISKKLLTEKGFEIDLELDEKNTRHEIVLFAENLGSIPPNTALIVITAGDKRYELFASASLEENAVLVFEYKPK